MKQRQRLKAIDGFSKGDRGVLVATDVAARGLDVKNVTTVIHYDVAQTLKTFVHRAGRTRGRAEHLLLLLSRPILAAPAD